MSIANFKKYLFGLIVSAYLITVIGIPVYLHYCGGELETINYVMKADSCCGGEEQEADDNGCCSDEGMILKSNPDFTIKDQHNFDTEKSVSTLFYFTLPFQIEFKINQPLKFTALNIPPPKQQANIISVSVLRI